MSDQSRSVESASLNRPASRCQPSIPMSPDSLGPRRGDSHDPPDVLDGRLIQTHPVLPAPFTDILLQVKVARTDACGSLVRE